jgi:hypothetical protein
MREKNNFSVLELLLFNWKMNEVSYYQLIKENLKVVNANHFA